MATCKLTRGFLCFEILFFFLGMSSSLLAQESSPSAAGKDLLLPTIEVAVGTLEVETDSKDEVGKEGSSASGSFYLNKHDDRWVYGLGLGIAKQTTTGTSDARGLKQKFEVRAPVIGLHGFYEFASGWLIGLQANTLCGKGAAFDPWNKDKSGCTVSMGPRAEWYHDFATHRFHSFLQGLTSLNIGNRRIVEVQLGVGIALFQDRKPEPAPAPLLAPEPAPPVQSEPEPVKEEVKAEAPPPDPVKITLSSSLVAFDRDSIKLRPRSKEFLEKFGAILVRFEATWSTLAISGHTDTSGKKSRNEYLSQGRADSVKTIFVGKGIDAKRLDAKGYADARLLPNLPPQSPDHRRVEISFGEVSGADAAEFQNALNQLIEEYKRLAQ